MESTEGKTSKVALEPMSRLLTPLTSQRFPLEALPFTESAVPPNRPTSKLLNPEPGVVPGTSVVNATKFRPLSGNSCTCSPFTRLLTSALSVFTALG